MDHAPPKYDVFLSHSSKDKPWADAACAVLERRGIRCWVAPRDIIPGEEWGESIIRGITGSRIMVLVFSGNANESAQVRREVERAVSRSMPLLPVRIEDVSPTGALEYALGNTHWLDAFRPPVERALEKLAESIEALIGKRAAVTSVAPTQAPSSPLISREKPAVSRGFVLGMVIAAALAASLVTFSVDHLLEKNARVGANEDPNPKPDMADSSDPEKPEATASTNSGAAFQPDRLPRDPALIEVAEPEAELVSENLGPTPVVEQKQLSSPERGTPVSKALEVPASPHPKSVLTRASKDEVAKAFARLPIADLGKDTIHVGLWIAAPINADDLAIFATLAEDMEMKAKLCAVSVPAVIAIEGLAASVTVVDDPRKILAMGAIDAVIIYGLYRDDVTNHDFMSQHALTPSQRADLGLTWCCQAGHDCFLIVPKHELPCWEPLRVAINGEERALRAAEKYRRIVDCGNKTHGNDFAQFFGSVRSRQPGPSNINNLETLTNDP